MDFKYATKDDILPDGTEVPAGTIIEYLPYSIQRNPLVWGADAEEWRPERWKDRKPSAFEFPVFNAGPRLCLGQRWLCRDKDGDDHDTAGGRLTSLVAPEKTTTASLTMCIADGLPSDRAPSDGNP